LIALLEPLPLHYFYGIATAFHRLTHILRSKAPIVEKNGAADTSKRRVSAHSGKNNSRHSDKYQRILDAAILVIAEHGYFQSRVSEIAERAGVADGTIYLYFKSKEEILKAAITSAFTEFLRRARRELEDVADPVAQLNRLAHLH